MKRIARRNAVALAATVASCTLLAPLHELNVKFRGFEERI